MAGITKPGRYVGKGIVKGSYFGLTANNAEQVTVALKFEGADEPFIDYWSLEGGAAKYTFDKLFALGWKGVPGDLTGIDQNKVTVKVQSETYKDEDRLIARFVDPWRPGPISSQPTQEQAAQLKLSMADKLKGYVPKAQREAGERQDHANAPTPTPKDDEAPPF